MSTNYDDKYIRMPDIYNLPIIVVPLDGCIDVLIDDTVFSFVSLTEDYWFLSADFPLHHVRNMLRVNNVPEKEVCQL